MTELELTASSPSAWLAIGQMLLVAVVLTVVGSRIARWAGLLDAGSTRGAVSSVGLAAGLCVAVPVWAAVASGGRSSFTPVALTYAIALVSALVRRGPDRPLMTTEARGALARWLPALAGAGLFLVAASLIYGATLAPRMRDGVQPVEFMDEAFYSVLARDLERTGIESIYAPAGFESLAGMPAQTWYHWGELWLGSAVTRIFGTPPLDARHLVVLPLLLLAAVGTAGALAQAFGRTRSRGAFVFGCVGSLLLLPVPWLLPSYQAHWEVGIAFNITFYGLAAVAAVLLLYCATLLRDGRQDWPRVLFCAGTVAILLPSHVLVFLLACVGIGVAAVLLAISIRRGSAGAAFPAGARRLGAVTCVVVGLTLAWGIATGHGLGGSDASIGVMPFGEAWRQTMTAMLVGAGVLYCVPLAWWVLRREDPYRAAIAAGTTAIAGAGIVAWGARLADYNMFHVFFSAIVVFVGPMAAACVWLLWQRAQGIARRSVAAVLMAACVLQILVGGAISLVRLERRGTGDYPPVPTAMLDAMRALPEDAKVAYACQPHLEIAIWDPWLLSLDAHTDRRIVPMCFQSDNLGALVGASDDPTVMSPFFRNAPQRSLYPTADATPPAAVVAAFLEEHDIGYIYQDAMHADTLVPWAVEVFSAGDFRLLRLP